MTEFDVKDNDSVDNPTPEHLAARKEWVRLLRIRKYTKYRQYLASPSLKKRCCLGVACDVAVAGVELPVTYVRDSKDAKAYAEINGHFAALPPDVMRTLGLTSLNPRVYVTVKNRAIETSDWYSLDLINDTEKSEATDDDRSPVLDRNWSHPQIADLIEATYITPYEDYQIGDD